MTVTATEADSIVKKHIKALEKGRDSDSAMDLMRVLSIIGPLATKEFMALPLAKKCQVWRDDGWSQENIIRLCGDMLDMSLGADWRDDPDISAAMMRKVHSVSA